MVVRASEPFDPLTGAPMLLGACAPRNLAVRDIAQQHVLKGVLRIPRDHGSPLPPDEVLPLECTQQAFHLGSGQATRRRDAAEPEDLPLHSGFSEQLLLGSE